MPGPYNGEMTTIERGHLGQSKPLSHCDHRGVDRTQRKVGIDLHQIAHPVQILVGDIDQNQAGPERAQERRFRLAFLTFLDELADFRDDRHGNEQRTRMAPQQCVAGFVVFVPDIYRCDRRPLINDYHEE